MSTPRRRGPIVERILNDERGWPPRRHLLPAGGRPRERGLHLQHRHAAQRRRPVLTTGHRRHVEPAAQRGQRGYQLDRWNWGAVTYLIDSYRTYVTNHEVGHFLGHEHEFCAGAGPRTPLMAQPRPRPGRRACTTPGPPRTTSPAGRATPPAAWAGQHAARRGGPAISRGPLIIGLSLACQLRFGRSGSSDSGSGRRRRRGGRRRCASPSACRVGPGAVNLVDDDLLSVETSRPAACGQAVADLALDEAAQQPGPVGGSALVGQPGPRAASVTSQVQAPVRQALGDAPDLDDLTRPPAVERASKMMMSSRRLRNSGLKRP